MTAATPPFDTKKIRITPLDDTKSLAGFTCSVREIDRWTRDKCVKHHNQNRTRVFCGYEEGSNKVLGFYCLSFASPDENQLRDDQYKDIYRGNGVPLIFVQYLAVLYSCQRNGLGKLLLLNALQRALDVAKNVAFYGVGLRPIDADVAKIYHGFGFRAKDETETNPLMILPIWTIADLFRVQL
jgi:GNAT superfamily N-acetyltransferase